MTSLESLHNSAPIDMLTNIPLYVNFSGTKGYLYGQSSPFGNGARGMVLYAEYALDAVAQAVRHALMLALYATSLQIDTEKAKQQRRG